MSKQQKVEMGRDIIEAIIVSIDAGWAGETRDWLNVVMLKLGFQYIALWKKGLVPASSQQAIKKEKTESQKAASDTGTVSSSKTSGTPIQKTQE